MTTITLENNLVEYNEDEHKQFFTWSRLLGQKYVTFPPFNPEQLVKGDIPVLEI